MSKNIAVSININEICRISTGTLVSGSVSSPCDIRIDGTIEGDVSSSGRVVIGEKGSVKGNVTCENLDVWGTLSGDAVVKDALSLNEGSCLKGDVKVSKLSVELGAEFQGTCSRG